MNRAETVIAFGLLACSLFPAASIAADEPAFDRKEDVIYARKFGTALTMDVFTPKANRNGAGIVFTVSGGFRSAHENINPAYVRPLLDRGYTVFAVVHGSQPHFTVPEIIQDMNRAVCFISRYQREGSRTDKDPHRNHRRLGGRPSVADAGDRGPPG